MDFFSSELQRKEYTVSIGPIDAHRIMTDPQSLVTIATRAGDEVVDAYATQHGEATTVVASAYLGPGINLPAFVRKLFKGSLLLTYNITWEPSDDGARARYLVYIGRKKESYVEGVATLTETPDGGTHVNDTFTAYVGKNKLFKKRLLALICEQARIMIPTALRFAEDLVSPHDIAA